MDLCIPTGAWAEAGSWWATHNGFGGTQWNLDSREAEVKGETGTLGHQKCWGSFRNGFMQGLKSALIPGPVLLSVSMGTTGGCRSDQHGDMGTHTRSHGDTGTHTRSHGDMGSHTRSHGDTGTHTRSLSDTGPHTRSHKDTGTHTRLLRDTDSHTRSHRDPSTHTRSLQR